MMSMTIGGRSVSSLERPYVIAEVSANHGGSLDAALELVQAAGQAGADAIKLQHYTPETITVRSAHPDFEVRGGTLWDGAQLADLYAEAMTPWEWTEDLIAAARRARIEWFSTPFDPTAVAFLAALDPPAYKIASFEIVDLGLIRDVASRGKPVIISTGMATADEIDRAVHAALGAGAEVALLRCNSAYPARPDEMDLRAIPTMSDIWQVPIGLSDHTRSHTAAVAAVALGACIIEKHLTLRRSDGGPDAEFSAEPDEFAALVTAVNEAHAALGSVRFGPSKHEMASLAFRRSLRAVQPICAGERFTSANVRSIRPSGGLAPSELDHVLGTFAVRDLAIGDPVTWNDLRTDDR
jgi:N-acetylneuraminate synthase